MSEWWKDPAYQAQLNLAVVEADRAYRRAIISLCFSLFSLAFAGFAVWFAWIQL